MAMTTRPLRQRFTLVAAAMLATFGLVLTGVVSTAQPADAATRYTMVNKKLVSKRYVNYRQTLASCSVGRTGQSCTISRLRSADRTIGLSLGASRSWAAAQLNISRSSTVATRVSCSSGKMKKNQVFRAYPVGKRYSYKIRKTSVPEGWGGYFSVKTSGTKYAFNPQKNGIHCR